jgi:hypothetical protein
MSSNQFFRAYESKITWIDGKPHFPVIYGYCYVRQNNRSQDGKRLRSKPVKGILCPVKSKREYNNWIGYANHSVFLQSWDAGFIPLKQTVDLPIGALASADDIVWSKTVGISSREYAETLEDATNGYNQHILKELTTDFLSFQNDCSELLCNTTELAHALALVQQALFNLQNQVQPERK